ncbi:hypothetical protein B9Z55_028963 [Caenorhabditis nigoni]|nr:hypothetical protein B9Z55_028963 [Caenorhabditis nigoni]
MICKKRNKKSWLYKTKIDIFEKLQKNICQLFEIFWNHHSELENSIEMQHQNKEIDNIDNIIFELANTNLETRLKAKALKMQEMMDDLDKLRRTECQELQLAVQSNKNYKELFKMACFSNPSAVAVLKNALKMVENDILDEESEETNNHPENENMNDTIIQKPKVFVYVCFFVAKKHNDHQSDMFKNIFRIKNFNKPYWANTQS